MTEVDFYILGEQTVPEAWHFACRLTQQVAQERKMNVLLQVDDQQDAKMLDDMLWTFQPEAFVPHALLENSASQTQVADCAQVHIGWQHQPGEHFDLLINLSRQIPPFFAQFDRMVEVVVQHDDVLNYTRKHYRFLKDRGYPIRNRDQRLRG